LPTTQAADASEDDGGAMSYMPPKQVMGGEVTPQSAL
jgi:hypothetical protein